jgi:hypothetical protein
VANVCTMKKTRGLYHVPERRNFNFSPGRFFGNGGYTYRAGCISAEFCSGLKAPVYTFHESRLLDCFKGIVSDIRFAQQCFRWNIGLGRNL